VIEIFRKIPEINTGVLKPPNWNFIKEGLKNNIETVENYYKTNIRPVRSNHFLVRLLQSITISKQLELDRFYNNVDSIALNHSMMLKMTSSIYKGNIFRGVFYGGTTPEILIATDEYFDIYETNNNWKNVSAVKPILHSKSDMNFQLPNGVEHSNESGLAVIVINIPMLAVQYRAFCIDEWTRNPDNPRGTIHFVGAYVLPNMIKAQTELAIFNRIYNKINNIESNNDNRSKHPFPLLNYKGYLDNAIDDVVEYLNKSSKSFRTIFHTLPSVYNEDMYQSLIVPDILNTRQVDWALVLSRLKMIEFLIKVADKDLLNKNQSQMNQVLKALRTNDVFKVFKEILPLDVYFTVEEQVDTILNSMGKNHLN
jgi:hypothetical protein